MHRFKFVKIIFSNFVWDYTVFVGCHGLFVSVLQNGKLGARQGKLRPVKGFNVVLQQVTTRSLLVPVVELFSLRRNVTKCTSKHCSQN